MAKGLALIDLGRPHRFSIARQREPAGWSFQPLQEAANVRRARVTASSKAKQKGQQAARSFRLVAGFTHDGAIRRICQRVPLASRADMVAGRAPIRRHRLATVGTWRADRGPKDRPQVRPSSRGSRQPPDWIERSNASRGTCRHRLRNQAMPARLAFRHSPHIRSTPQCQRKRWYRNPLAPLPRLHVRCRRGQRFRYEQSSAGHRPQPANPYRRAERR